MIIGKFNKEFTNNGQGRINYILGRNTRADTLAAISTTRKNERMIRLFLVLKWYKGVVIIMLAFGYKLNNTRKSCNHHYSIFCCS